MTAIKRNNIGITNWFSDWFCRVFDATPFYKDRAGDRSELLKEVAERHGCRHIDEVAEEVTLAFDRRIKVKRSWGGKKHYWYKNRLPWNKFRGFTGTLLVNYFPASLLFLFLPMAMLISGQGIAGRYAIKGVSQGTLWFLLGVALVLFTWRTVSNTRATLRYFWIHTMTEGRTQYGICAHILVLTSLAVIWVGALLFMFLSKQGPLASLIAFPFQPQKWPEVWTFAQAVPDILRNAFEPSTYHPRGIPLLETLSPQDRNAWVIVFAMAPVAIIVITAVAVAIPSWTILTAPFAGAILLWQIATGKILNTGSASIVPIINRLEEDGHLSIGLAEQAAISKRFADYAEAQIWYGIGMVPAGGLLISGAILLATGVWLQGWGNFGS